MGIIEIKNYSWHFFENEEHDLVNLNLSIKKGEFIGLIGPSGAGKTALCYSLMGIIPHLSNGRVLKGDVVVDGWNTKTHSVGELASKVGLILQASKSQLTGAGLTVEEEIAFGLENKGVPRSEMIKKLDEVIKLTGLESVRKRSPFEVSGGQQQKVAIASVLVMDPKVLVLDEPTGFLDPSGTKMVFDTVKRLNEDKGMTIIFVTHSYELLAEHADRVLLLANGKIVKDGSPHEVLTDTKTLTRHGLIPLPVTSMAEKLPWKGKLPININEAFKGVKRLIR